MKKLFYLIVIVLTSELTPAERLGRCSNCSQQKHDAIPALMAQTAMDIFINGFIATQSEQNSQEQKQAVVSALTSLAGFLQAVLKSAHERNISPEEVLAELNVSIADAKVLRTVTQLYTMQKLKLASLTQA